MKRKQLELFLEHIPDFSHPKPWLEQYKTPSPIASDMLFIAYGSQDIMGKSILDLGCGTGIFSIGAKRLQATQVTGVDIDSESISQATQFAQDHHLDIEFICADISTITDTYDTVLMNPPFGAQKQNIHADRAFIETAVTHASVTYSLHPSHTLEFIGTLLKSLQKQGEIVQTYQFSIPAQFHFHTKLKDTINVSLLKIT